MTRRKGKSPALSQAQINADGWGRFLGRSCVVNSTKATMVPFQEPITVT
jgi:hypothetical protein